METKVTYYNKDVPLIHVWVLTQVGTLFHQDLRQLRGVQSNRVSVNLYINCYWYHDAKAFWWQKITTKHHNTQLHTTTLHKSTRIHKTTNVPVVFMARYVMILRGATSLLWALEGVGPENRDFFGPWNGTSEASAIWAQKSPKKGPPLPMPLVMMLQPSKSLRTAP